MNDKKELSRTYYGNLSAGVGIACNLVLFGAKLAVGLLFGVISIVADAFNNLSDLGSNFVSLVGFKIASQPADRQHPYGHARAEYITAMIVSFIIFMLGLELIKSAFDKILHPAMAEFSIYTVIVLLFSIGVKLFMFLFNRRLGVKCASPVLKATAFDSISDVIATSGVLVAVLVGKFFNVDLDAPMAIVVAILIIVGGIKLIKSTFSQLLGEGPTDELSKQVRAKLLTYDGVLGIHDLMVHNYGPNNIFASVHVEVDASKPIMVSHDMIDLIERDFSNQMHLVIHLDPIVVGDPLVDKVHLQVLDAIESIDQRLTLHDFRMVVGTTHTNLIFDVVVPFECKLTTEELTSEIDRLVKKIDPTYFTVINVDRD